MRFLLLFLMFISMNSFAIITDPMSNQVNNSGVVNKKDKAFIRIKNGSGGSLASGSVVVFDTTADDGMTVNTTTTAGKMAACITADDTLANGAYGKCQIYGYAIAKFDFTAGGGATASSAFYASTTAGKIQAVASPSASQYPVGIFLDNSTSSEDVEVFIKNL